MRPRRDSAPTDRRDDGVRAIRTNEVRYPGLDLPDPEPSPDVAENGSRFGTFRDTGLAVETRLGRHQANAAKRQQRTVVIVAAVIGLLLVAGIGWRWASDRQAAANPTQMDNGIVGFLGGSTAAHSGGSASSTTAIARSSATPIFANYGKIMLHLPVPVGNLTEIGFHQASYPSALRMKTKLHDAKISVVAKNRTTGRDPKKQPTQAGAWLNGEVIRMWRNRPGKPDTAADVGAKPGTTVLSPVTGTVVKIKSYKLYGKYPDYEVHIVPEGANGIDLVMIHMSDLSCEVGQSVLGGLTPIGKVRKLSDKFHDQLSDYTKGGGDHVHIQVNNAEYPGYKGLIGAIEPESASDIGSATPGD
jgi:murein DD-endopeptidase MepM/ murein hydrolase activator NlpD